MSLAWIASVLLFIVAGILTLRLWKERRLRIHLQETLTGLEVGMRTLEDSRNQFDKAAYHQSLSQKEMRLSKAMISLEHSLTLSVELALKSLKGHTCAVFFVDRSTSSPALVLKTISSASKHLIKDVRILPGDGLLGLTLKEQKAIHFPQLTENMARVLPYYSSVTPVKSLFAVPVIGESGMEGLLTLDRLTADPLTQDEQHVFNLLSRQLTTILSEAKTHDRTEDHTKELLALYEASKALSTPISVDSTIATIVKVAKQTVRCHSVLLALLDDTHRLVVKGTDGYDASKFSSGQVIPQEGLFEWVIRQRKPVLFQGKPGSAGLPTYLAQGLTVNAQSFIMVPLLLENEVTGILKCDSAEANFFTEYDMEIFGILANQAALALERANQFDGERQKATTDALTGLANRHQFQEQVARLFHEAQTTQSPLALVLCDVDHFKRINDTYGHLQGDTVLKQLGLILLKSCRTNTLIARYGGEEFAFLLPHADGDSARKMAERIRERVQQELRLGVNGQSIPVTASLGVASFPQDAQDPRSLFQRADEALYRAKSDGRNLVR